MISRMRKHGYWIPHTSTVDWCENNYEVTPFIAEYWNTISSAFVTICLIWTTTRSWKKIDLKFNINMLMIVIVGIGSTLFHATLTYWGQLADEIPMIWGTATLIYTLFEVNRPIESTKKQSVNKQMIFILFATCLFATIIYTISYLYVLFLLIYSCMAAATYLKLFSLSKSTSSKCRWFVFSSFGIYVISFTIWLCDSLFCKQLTSLRTSIWTSVNYFTQLHAIWHIGASYAAYVSVLAAVQARSEYLERKSNIKTWYYQMPYV